MNQNNRPWHQWFKPTSALTESERSSVRAVLAGRQPFSIYFNAALQDLDIGINNRHFYIHSDSGVAMAIEFDEITIFSVIGEVHEDLLFSIALNPRRTEFHLTNEHAELVADTAPERICRRANLVYYLLQSSNQFEMPDVDLRRLRPADLDLVSSFYAEHYPQTVFSTWMLERPFVGLFHEGKLVSSGGTIVIDHTDRAANIGNFLTAPQFRARGYSQLVLKYLLNELMKQDIGIFSLGTTSDNVPACKAYESAGFLQLETRIELEMNRSL